MHAVADRHAGGTGTRLAEERDMMKTLRDELGAIGWLLRTATMAAFAGAIITELRLPPEQRTWHGKLLGFVPYDFRMPTPKRFMDAFWSPRSKQLFSDQPFGVGWAVNIPVAIATVAAMLPGRKAPARRASTARKAAA
jgi:hypothetical protein